MLRETAMHAYFPIPDKNIQSITGNFPFPWKKYYFPIPKFGDKQSPTNYRPISFIHGNLLGKHLHYTIAECMSTTTNDDTIPHNALMQKLQYAGHIFRTYTGFVAI